MRYSPLLAALLTLTLSQAAWAGYRWKDHQGRTHYGDVMPSEFVKYGYAEIDKKGKVIKLYPPPPSKEELKKRAEAELANKKAAEIQDRQDRSLLSSYTSPEEIDRARDRALEQEKLQLSSLEVRRKQTLERHAQAQDRAKRAQIERGKVPPYIAQQLEEAQTELDALNRDMTTRNKNLETIRQRYEADKARFIELTRNGAPR